MYYSSFGNSPPHDHISVMLFAFINGDFLHHLSRKIDKNVRCQRISEFKYLCIFYRDKYVLLFINPSHSSKILLANCASSNVSFRDKLELFQALTKYLHILWPQLDK